VASKSAKKDSGRSRIDRLRLSFSSLHADAFLVTHLPNIQYLCGFTGSAGVLLVEPARATLFTDSRYTFQAREEVFGAAVRVTKHGLLRAATEALKPRRGRLQVAYSPAQVTVAQKVALTAGAGARVRWVSGNGVVERLRAVKDAGELGIMLDAAKLISEVFAAIVPRLSQASANSCWRRRSNTQ
jgi:Xaa-Pro aminopeptidase